MEAKKGKEVKKEPPKKGGKEEKKIEQKEEKEAPNEGQEEVEKKEEIKPEVKQEPPEDNLKITFDFKDMIRAQLSIIKEDKEKTKLEETRTKQLKEQKHKEEAELKRQKFGTLKKKSPFLTANKKIETFSDKKELVTIHDKFQGGGDLLLLPDRAIEKKVWNPIKCRSGAFKEIPEKLDEKTKKFMEEGDRHYLELIDMEREEYKKSNDGTIKKSIMDQKLKEEKVWKPNSFKKGLFKQEIPLIDCTHSVEEQYKITSPDRMWEKKVWSRPGQRL